VLGLGYVKLGLDAAVWLMWLLYRPTRPPCP